MGDSQQPSQRSSQSSSDSTLAQSIFANLYNYDQSKMKTLICFYFEILTLTFNLLETLDWPQTWPACAGTVQSPVIIDTSSAKQKKFSPIRNVGTPKSLNAVTFSNTGGTLQMTLNSDSSDALILKGGPMGNEKYKFFQLHFHWTKTNNDRCEHHVDEIRLFSLNYFVNLVS